MTLARSSDAKTKIVFLRLEPGYWYDQYTDDPVFVQSLRNWKVTVAKTPQTEEELKRRGIPYTIKKGCPCSGGAKIQFPGIEVV